MWELSKRISLRSSSVLSKVEPEPDLYTGSDQNAPAPTGSATVVIVIVILTVYSYLGSRKNKIFTVE